MKFKCALETGSLAFLGLGAIGTGVATAQPTRGGAMSPGSSVAPASSHGPQNVDTIHQGDQTTPGVAGQGEAVDTSESPGISTGVADGPAGHADPAGNVDNNGGSNKP